MSSIHAPSDPLWLWRTLIARSVTSQAAAMAADDAQVAEGQQLTHQAISEPLLAANAAGTDAQPRQVPPQAAAALSAGPASSPAGVARNADPMPQAPLAASDSAAADLPMVNGYADRGGHASDGDNPAGCTASGQPSGDNHSY